jgi:L-serine dehydratase
MPVSVLDFFTIGIGPSSSHAVGPMRAARRFVDELESSGATDAVTHVRAELFGSLALTGIGHGTDRSVLMGLEGAAPETVDPDAIGPRVAEIAATHTLQLAGRRDVPFDPQADLAFHRRERLPRHTNGLRFTASFGDGRAPLSREYYSIGGGFVISSDESGAAGHDDDSALPCPFHSSAELLHIARTHRLSISQIALANENALRPEDETRDRLLTVWQAMQDCIAKGCRTDGILPGGLNIERRAPALFRRLAARADAPLAALDWVNVFALAVNEENAAGGRVVTAPTNGAAGIIPAVLMYYRRFDPDADDEGVLRFLLTAGAIAMLYKRNASISGAEVGCQGEVGVACSMAAAGLTEAQSGTPAQIEQAAEIGMEHNLGLTCDPIKGLVQIPCIERNAMGAVKAINAARLALSGDGKHVVSLDRVIEVMRRTGADMSTKYKETSRGGLAVNVAEC